jgi:hypothetical protein
MSKQQPDKYKKNLLIALRNHAGLITPACNEVGISRQQYYYYLKNDKDFKEAVEDIHEETIDFVESKLLEKIEQGSERSILFFMKYRGKKRGYTDTIDITSNGETINTVSNINIKVVEPKNDK